RVKGYVSRRYGPLPGSEMPALTEQVLTKSNATLILTDHDAFDYDQIVKFSTIVIDTRNATRNVAHGREKIILV
ncbi:MAG TPA: hypothetical protein VMV98_08080, partial [Acidobacteriaceae bacterium]|nr:hypothetical protein [Acidobacteriaceae bacterium]